MDIKTTSATVPVRVFSGAVAAATADVEVYTGQPVGAFAAGAISITGGSGGTAGGAGGAIFVAGGSGAATQNGNGGALSLIAGDGTGTGSGADVTLQPGGGGASSGKVDVQDSNGNSLIRAGASGGLSLGYDGSHGVRALIFQVNNLGGGSSATLSNAWGSGYAMYRTSAATLTLTISGMPDGFAVYVVATNAAGCAVSSLATGSSGAVAQGQVKMFVVIGDELYSQG